MKYTFLLISSALVTICNAGSEPTLRPELGSAAWLEQCERLAQLTENDEEDNLPLDASFLNGSASPITSIDDDQKVKTSPQQIKIEAHPTARKMVVTQNGMRFFEGSNGLFSPILIKNYNLTFSATNLFSHLSQEGMRYVPYGIGEKFLTQHNQMGLNDKRSSLPDKHILFIGQLPALLPQAVLEHVLKKITGHDCIDAMRTSMKEKTIALVSVQHNKALTDMLYLDKRIIWDLYGAWFSQSPIQSIEPAMLNVAGNYYLSRHSMVIEPGSSHRCAHLMTGMNNIGVRGSILKEARQLQHLVSPAQAANGDLYHFNDYNEGSPMLVKPGAPFPSKNILSFPNTRYVPYGINRQFLCGNNQLGYDITESAYIPSECRLSVKLPPMFPLGIFKNIIQQIIGKDAIISLRKAPGDNVILIFANRADLDSVFAYNNCIYLDVYGAHIHHSPPGHLKVCIPKEYLTPRYPLRYIQINLSTPIVPAPRATTVTAPTAGGKYDQGHHQHGRGAQSDPQDKTRGTTHLNCNAAPFVLRSVQKK